MPKRSVEQRRAPVPQFTLETQAMAQAAQRANWQLRYNLLAHLQAAQLVPESFPVEQPAQPVSVERSVGALGFTAQQQQAPAVLGREATGSTFPGGISVEEAPQAAAAVSQDAPAQPEVMPPLTEAERMAADARQVIAELTGIGAPYGTPTRDMNISTPEDAHV